MEISPILMKYFWRWKMIKKHQRIFVTYFQNFPHFYKIHLFVKNIKDEKTDSDSEKSERSDRSSSRQEDNTTRFERTPTSQNEDKRKRKKLRGMFEGLIKGKVGKKQQI